MDRNAGGLHDGDTRRVTRGEGGAQAPPSFSAPQRARCCAGAPKTRTVHVPSPPPPGNSAPALLVRGTQHQDDLGARALGRQQERADHLAGHRPPAPERLRDARGHGARLARLDDGGAIVNGGESPDQRAEQKQTTCGERFRCGEGLTEDLRGAATGNAARA